MAYLPVFPDMLDTSYSNNAVADTRITISPSRRWIYRVWLDAVDPADREFDDAPRVTLERLPWTGDLEERIEDFDAVGDVVLETESWDEALQLIQRS